MNKIMKTGAETLIWSDLLSAMSKLRHVQFHVVTKVLRIP